jgi:hypothetical protein
MYSSRVQSWSKGQSSKVIPARLEIDSRPSRHGPAPAVGSAPQAGDSDSPETPAPTRRYAMDPAKNCRTWLGREDSNLRMTESKSVALPLGDAPPEPNSGPAGDRPGLAPRKVRRPSPRQRTAPGPPTGPGEFRCRGLSFSGVREKAETGRAGPTHACQQAAGRGGDRP